MTTKKNDRFVVRAGSLKSPGAVIKTFQGAYKCGGPATACLRWFFANRTKIGPAFFQQDRSAK